MFVTDFKSVFIASGSWKCGKVKINPSKSFLKVLMTEKTSVKKGKSFSRDLKVKKITKGHAICPS